METPEYAFMSAVHAGDLEKVRSLVERNPRLVEAQSSSDTALGSAAMGRRVAIVRYLLDNGADATRRPFEGAETPLASACFATRDQDEILEVVLLLLERGADASLPGRDGVTPLMIASWGGYARVVEALLVHGCGNVDQQHSEVDSDGRQNTTALLRAFCDDEYVGVARLLLRAGADPTIADGEGETFVAIASREGYDDSRALYQVRAYVIHGRPAPHHHTAPGRFLSLICVHVSLCCACLAGVARRVPPRQGPAAPRLHAQDGAAAAAPAPARGAAATPGARGGGAGVPCAADAARGGGAVAGAEQQEGHQEGQG
jgi:hypothetical protein